MKYRNLTGKTVSFSIPIGQTVKWMTVTPNEIIDVSLENEYRAKAFGLTSLEKPKEVPKPAPKPVVKPKKKK